MTTPTYLDRITAYADRVIAGAETAGRFERLACERFMRDVQRQGTADFPYVLDVALGTRACRFIELLPHIKGEWAKPIYVDGKFSYAKLRLEDWQLFVDFQLFGWVHMTTRLRRFRRSYEEVARKNAKSTRAAGRFLYMLSADKEPGAHCYSAATTGEQAREVFDVARNMAQREPEFLSRFGVECGKHDITIPSTASSAKPLNAEGSTLDGLNIHGVRKYVAASLAGHGATTHEIAAVTGHSFKTCQEIIDRRFAGIALIDDIAAELRESIRSSVEDRERERFRVGQADPVPALLAAGVAPDRIEMMGRWRSDAMRIYLRMGAYTVTKEYAQLMLDSGAYSFAIPNTADHGDNPPPLLPEALPDSLTDLEAVYIDNLIANPDVLPTTEIRD